MLKIIENTDLDYAIAEEFFGWKWLSWLDMPTKSHPQYQDRVDVRVRMFMTPESQADESWREFWATHDMREADGTEPLHYRYCSMNGPAMVPNYSGCRDDCDGVEREIRKRKLFPQYRQQLAAQCRALRKDGTINDEKVHFASCEQRCIAALTVVGSRHVIPDPEAAR